MRHRLAVFAALTGLVLTTMPAATSATVHRPGTAPAVGVQLAAEPALASDGLTLFRPSQAPLGRAWKIWSARYMAWYQEIPVRRNPGLHPNSPRNCERRFGVTLMGPVGTGRVCEVRADRPVLLAFLAWSCSTAEGNGRAWRVLRRCSIRSYERELSDVRVRLHLDGQKVDEPGRWKFDSARRVIRLPKRNVWGVSGGRTRMVGRGLFYMLRPMAPGEHVVRVVMKEAGERTLIRYRFTAA